MAHSLSSGLDKSQPGWYLSLMAPNTKGPQFAWLDPSRLYTDREAFAACVADLSSPFSVAEGQGQGEGRPEGQGQGEGRPEVDLVCGIDAMGFILGAAIAARMGTGFLALRKAGHLCVVTDECGYSDYQRREKVMEVRADPFPAGTRVLLVDQWIETGGTMTAAVTLVERHGGVVAGIATICCENSPGGRKLRDKYKMVHCVPEGLQEKFDSHTFEML